jgi:hypothetical protein
MALVSAIKHRKPQDEGRGRDCSDEPDHRDGYLHIESGNKLVKKLKKDSDSDIGNSAQRDNDQRGK